MPDQFQNPFAPEGIDQLALQYQAAQDEVDPNARLAYELAKMDYGQQQRDYDRSGGRGLLGFVFNMLRGDRPDSRTVAQAMGAYFQENEDAKTAARIQEQLQSAQKYRGDVVGANQKDRAKIQNRLNMAQELYAGDDAGYRLAAGKIIGGGGGVTVNTGNQFAPGDKRLQEQHAEVLTGMQQAAVATGQKDAAYDKIEEILNRLDAAGNDTGRLQDVAAAVGQWFGAEVGADRQALEAFSGNLVMERLNEMKGAAQIAERQYLQGLEARMGTDRRANLEIIQFGREMGQRTRDNFSAAREAWTKDGHLLNFMGVTPNVPEQQEQPSQAAPTAGEPTDDELIQRYIDAGGDPSLLRQ